MSDQHEPTVEQQINAMPLNLPPHTQAKIAGWWAHLERTGQAAMADEMFAAYDAGAITLDECSNGLVSMLWPERARNRPT
jgi:hypothetical protein